ncbi:calpain-13 isoform X3 [Melanerpes formicivorus]
MLAPGSALPLDQGWQAAGDTGSFQNLKKFNNQDFTQLRALCLSQGLLFEDSTFPAHLSSIGHSVLPEELLRRIQWKRPTDLQRNPHLVVDGVSRFDIMQGEIGDCWMLAALGSLTLQKKFLENVLPRDQGFQDQYAGIFHFRFWQCGAWVDVVIDDRLPLLDGSFLSVHPRTSNEFWPALLEKAYAKLRGSYQHLHGGYLSDALVDFTGGVQVQFSLKDPPPDLEEILKAADRSQCLMGCSTSGQSKRNIELRNGIVQGHAYTVTGAVKIPYQNGWKHIIRIWNPWGHGEWKGPWSDNSPQWDHVEPQYREALLRNKDDGEFWMSCESFQEQFSWLYICNSTPTFLDFGEQHCTRWCMDRHSSLWSPALATGRSSSSPGGVSSHPQYLFKVPDDDPKPYNVLISLMQKHTEEDAKNLKIGFVIIKKECGMSPTSEKTPKKGWHHLSLCCSAQDPTHNAWQPQDHSEVLEQVFSLARDVTSYFTLSPGTYAVLPAAAEEQQFQFLLRIFTKHRGNQESSNPPPSPVLPMALPRQNEDSSCKALFLRYAKQDSGLDALQLQQLLNEVILQDEVTSLGGRFSFDSCRGILALMDLHSNGRLTLQEFRSLWRSLTEYLDVFSRADRTHSGFLDVSELKRAIQMAGLAVDEQLLRLLVLRYGDTAGRVGFSDFCCCLLRLHTMTYAFQNLAEGGSQISMTSMEWLTLVMYT